MLKVPFSRTIKPLINEYQIKKELNKQGWLFSPVRFGMYRAELSDWEKFYQPIKLKNKIVLDAGAGEGETAKFFLDKGADMVLAVEPDRSAYTYLQKNACRHNIIPLNRVFSINDLNLNVGFVKLDIEGYEEILLSHLDKITMPIVVEVHGLQLRDRFKDAGFKIQYSNLECRQGFSCCSIAYMNC